MDYTRNNGKNTGDKWTEKGDQFLLRQGKDYDHGAITHDRFGIIDDADGSYWGQAKNASWRTGALKGPDVGGTSPGPKHDYYDTKPVEPISRTSKGQRKTLGKSRGDKYEE